MFENGADIATDGDMAGSKLVEFGRVDINMDYLGLRAEFGQFAGGAIIEAGANDDK